MTNKDQHVHTARGMDLPPELLKVQKNQCLTGESLIQLSTLFEDRFWKAIRTVAEERVKKYIFQPSKRIHWIVVGRERDYLILSDHYCSCQDFYIKVVIQREINYCYHLLAKLLAESLSIYSEIRVEDERYFDLMDNWKIDISPDE